ncbi:MAG: hypothetical protein J6386_17725 [Candidatus Synoicihabitans palmerolidicus]|nr:hypothetical protein [Candidatus Synoicihabitans palmerolidicus]
MLDGRDLRINSLGSAEWNAGDIALTNTANILNAGDLFINASGSISAASAEADLLVQNTGTLTKQSGSGSTTITVPFENSGHLTVLDGQLFLTADSTLSSSGQVNLGQTTSADIPITLLATDLTDISETDADAG